MKLPGSHSRNGLIWAASLLLATIGTTVATQGAAALAAPLSPARTSLDLHAGKGGDVEGTSPGKVSWSILPATAKGPDLSRNLFSYGTIKPGSTILDHFEVVNRSRQAAAFSIYGTDAAGTTLANDLLLQPPGTKPTDVGAWVSFPGGAAQLSTVIPAEKAVIMPFTINVPQLATPGDHTGALVAAVSILARNKAGSGITENYRIAVPIEFRVPGALRAAVQIQSISNGFSDPFNPFGSGSATISYTVANVGNVRQTGTQVVTVTGPFGQKTTVRPPKLPTILPGDSVRVSVSLPGLYPAGPMTARVTVAPGWPPRTPALAKATPIANGSASLFALPWSLAGFILLLIAIGVGVRQFLRWRGRLHRAEIASAAARASRDTERRLLSSKPAPVNGNGGHPAAQTDPAATPEAGSAPADAAASTGTKDTGSTAE